MTCLSIMATGSDCSKLSTFNRRYRYDLQIVYHCQNLPPTFLRQIDNKKLQHVSADAINFDIKEAFRKSVCVLCLLCQHNVESIGQHIERLDETFSRRIVLCSTDSGIAEENDSVDFIEIGNGVSYGVLFRKIHSVLDGSKLYDDSGSTTPVKRSPVHARSSPLPKYASRSEQTSSPISYHGEANDDHTSRSISYHGEANDDHIYEPLLQYACISKTNMATGRFVGATSLEPNNDGIQIHDSLVLPKDTANILRDEKYIKNIKLSKLAKEYRLKEIADHLNIPISGLKTRVIESLTDVCFKMPQKAEICVEIHHVLKTIWAFLEKWKQDVEMVKSVTLLSNLILAKLFLLFLNTDCEIGQITKLIEKELTPRVSSWMRLKEIDKKVKVLLSGAKSFMEDFVKIVQKGHNVIQFGDWNESLRSKTNQKTMIESVHKMTLIEKAASMLGLLWMKCNTNIHITELPSMIETVCTSCLHRLRKMDPSVIYSFSILAARSIVYWIKDLKETEDGHPCMRTIETFLLYKAWTKDQKQTLLQEIWTLIAHACDVVRWKVVNILASTKCDDMRKIAYSILESSCRYGKLFITQELQYYGSEKDRQNPRWSDCKGVFGNTEIRLKILVPTKGCVLEHVARDYSNRQIEGNERFRNTMSILSDIHRDGGHDNVAKLLAYQLTHMPIFYAVQEDGAKNILTFLLERREQKNWCCLTELNQYIKDALSAMCYLHSNNMIHRDITSCRFDVFLQKKSLKLSDFRLTEKLHRFNDTLCSDVSSTLAVRWSAIETLKDDHFSTKSDVWMFALFMFEVYTHGCWPYSELVNKETVDIMHMVVIRGYNQSQPRCIPDKVFKLMLSCLDQRAGKRPSLQELQNQLAPILESGLSESSKQCSSYLNLQPKQKKMNGQPELGDHLPHLIHQLKNRKEYVNMKFRPVTRLPLQHEDLIAEYEPEMKQDKERGTITVNERLDAFSKAHNLPNYQRLREINDIPHYRLEKLVDTGETYYSYTYSDKEGESLLDHAFKNEDSEALCKLLYLLAKRIRKFHDNGWIVRCLSAKDIWKTDRGKICLLRLGRACELLNDAAGGGHARDEPFKDRSHWLPLEVHRDGFYTKKSDIYMFAMVIYEVFTAFSFNAENPLRNPLLCVPFAMTSRNDLQDILENGKVPDKPEHCPASLYRMMVMCWQRNAVNRPDISEILKRMKEIIKKHDFNTEEEYMSEFSSLDPYDSSFSDIDTDTDTDDDQPADKTMCEEWTKSVPPPLPTRNRPRLGDVTQTYDSSSNDSFPKGPPQPFSHSSNTSDPMSLGCTNPKQSDSEENISLVIENKSIEPFEDITNSDVVKMRRRKPKKWIRNHEKTFHQMLKTNTELSGPGCVPDTSNENDYYLTPTECLDKNTDVDNENNIHLPVDNENVVKYTTLMFSGKDMCFPLGSSESGIQFSDNNETSNSSSKDSFPTCPAHPFTQFTSAYNSTLSLGPTFQSQSESDHHVEHRRRTLHFSTIETDFREHERIVSKCEKGQENRRKPKRWIRSQEVLESNKPPTGREDKFFEGILEDNNDDVVQTRHNSVRENRRKPKRWVRSQEVLESIKPLTGREDKCIGGINEDNDDYLTPSHHPEGNVDGKNESFNADLHSTEEQENGVKRLSFDASSPSGPAQTFFI